MFIEVLLFVVTEIHVTLDSLDTWKIETETNAFSED